MNLDADIALAHRLADAAGAAIRPHFRAGLGSESKDDATPVTLADREAAEAMRRILKAEAPRDGIIGEELGSHDDPIDGPVSFIAGRPIFGTLTALVVEGFPVLGIIDQPILRERWAGARGRPTTFNAAPCQTRRCRELSGAMLATTGPHYFDDHDGAHFMALAARTDHRRMMMGGDCYNYALLASGHLDIV